MDKIRQYLYYILIGLISFVALAFLPMLGTTVGLGWNTPNTTVGWIVWVVTKLIVAVLNVLIFYCFMEQAKVNVRDNENYKRARDILIDTRHKDSLPKSPKKWNIEQYSKKGVSIFIASGLSAIALTQAILTFDYIQMLTYLFTIIMGLIFGVLQMKTAEQYWTTEFLEYALMIQKQLKSQEGSDDNNRQQAVQELGGAGTEE